MNDRIFNVCHHRFGANHPAIDFHSIDSGSPAAVGGKKIVLTERPVRL